MQHIKRYHIGPDSSASLCWKGQKCDENGCHDGRDRWYRAYRRTADAAMPDVCLLVGGGAAKSQAGVDSLPLDLCGSPAYGVSRRRSISGWARQA